MGSLGLPLGQSESFVIFLEFEQSFKMTVRFTEDNNSQVINKLTQLIPQVRNSRSPNENLEGNKPGWFSFNREGSSSDNSSGSTSSNTSSATFFTASTQSFTSQDSLRDTNVWMPISW